MKKWRGEEAWWLSSSQPIENDRRNAMTMKWYCEEKYCVSEMTACVKYYYNDQ